MWFLRFWANVRQVLQLYDNCVHDTDQNIAPRNSLINQIQAKYITWLSYTPDAKKQNIVLVMPILWQ